MMETWYEVLLNIGSIIKVDSTVRSNKHFIFQKWSGSGREFRTPKNSNHYKYFPSFKEAHGFLVAVKRRKLQEAQAEFDKVCQLTEDDIK